MDRTTILLLALYLGAAPVAKADGALHDERYEHLFYGGAKKALDQVLESGRTVPVGRHDGDSEHRFKAAMERAVRTYDDGHTSAAAVTGASVGTSAGR